jgi:hypothetical protein
MNIVSELVSAGAGTVSISGALRAVFLLDDVPPFEGSALGADVTNGAGEAGATAYCDGLGCTICCRDPLASVTESEWIATANTATIATPATPSLLVCPMTAATHDLASDGEHEPGHHDECVDRDHPGAGRATSGREAVITSATSRRSDRGRLRRLRGRGVLAGRGRAVVCGRLGVPHRTARLAARRRRRVVVGRRRVSRRRVWLRVMGSRRRGRVRLVGRGRVWLRRRRGLGWRRSRRGRVVTHTGSVRRLGCCQRGAISSTGGCGAERVLLVVLREQDVRESVGAR